MDLNSSEITNFIKQYLLLLIKKYPWLIVRYEYNKCRHAYLVSYDINKDNIDNNDFYKDAMSIEEKIESKYDDILFCENERLFRLSSDAELLSHKDI